ncbi:MAG: transcriptional regulator [Hyphococcus sp.]|nr:MAG: transcriptional regulator [Marinicaulis sp.]
MIEEKDILELVLRGGAAGISFLLAIVLATRTSGARTRVLGALFSFSIGVYVLLSSEMIEPLFGVFRLPAVFIAIWGTVFFWWFAASFFDDDFRWRWWRIAPVFILPALFLLRYWLGDGATGRTFTLIHLLMNAALFADIIRIAIVNISDDLIDPRRRFRVALALVVAVAGIGIATAEILETVYKLPAYLELFHAAIILALNLFFAGWLLAPKGALFGPAVVQGVDAQTESRISKPIPISNQPEYQRLMRLMDEGVYLEDGLTVARLAEKVGVPEHHLRALINGALGFRNFSSFLNERRVEDAKKALTDPTQSRKQVLQIALELGYGSIAPFNRAFKNATGQTPSEFRKTAQGNHASQSSDQN